MTGLAGGLVFGLARPGTGSDSPLTPMASWKHDRNYGLALGFAAGLATGLTTGLVFGLTTGLVFALGSGIAVGLVPSAFWRISLACAQLSLDWQIPVRLMAFLEDARQRDILRTVGPVYQSGTPGCKTGWPVRPGKAR